MDDSMTVPRPALVLIGGTGRSGTNILKAIFAQHNTVATLPFEYRFMVDPDGVVDFYRSALASWTPFMADARLRRLEQLLHAVARQPKWHRAVGALVRQFDRSGRWMSPQQYHGYELRDHLPNFEQHCATLLSELRDFMFPACWVGTPSYQKQPKLSHMAFRAETDLLPPIQRFFNRIVADYLQAQGRSVFVEDNTWNIFCARELLQFAPQARLIHIFRDPRDVVASFMQQRWSPRNAEQAACWYRDMLAYWWRIRDELPSGTTVEISLESLVNQREASLQTICTHVGIRFDPAMLSVELTQANQGRWQQDLSAQEKQVVEKILAPTIERLGYQ